MARRHKGVVSERYKSPLSNSPRTEQMEMIGQMFIENLRIFCPWIMMMIIFLSVASKADSRYLADMQKMLFWFVLFC